MSRFASLENEVFSCTLDCTARPDGITVEVRAPESIAGIRAVEETCFSRPWSEEAIRSELENGYSALFAALKRRPSYRTNRPPWPVPWVVVAWGISPSSMATIGTSQTS